MSTNLKDVVVDVTLTKTIQVSPDEDSKKAGVHKTVILKVRYDGLTLQDVFMKALDKDVVSWQNGSGGRKNYANLVDKGTVEIDAKSPGKAPEVDPVTAIIAAANAEGISVEDYVRREAAKRSHVLRKAPKE